MESIDPDKNIINAKAVVDKLRNLPEDEFSADAIQFAGALAIKLPKKFNYVGFAITSDFVMYDQAVGVDLFGGTDDDIVDAGWDDTAQEKFTMLAMEFPVIVRAVLPPEFADIIIDELVEADKEILLRGRPT